MQMMTVSMWTVPDMVTTCPAPSGQSLLFQSAGFGQQVGGRAGFIIGAEQSDHAGDAVTSELAQPDPGNLRGETILATPAGRMDVGVDQARNQFAALQIQGFNQQGVIDIGNIRPAIKNLAATQQNTSRTKRFGCIDFSVYDQCQH